MTFSQKVVRMCQMSPTPQIRRTLEKHYTPEERKRMRESWASYILPKLIEIKTNYKKYDTWDKLGYELGISRRSFARWIKDKKMSYVCFKVVSNFIDKHDKK